MQTWKKVHLLHSLLIINLFFPTCIAQQTPLTYCGKIRLQTPFLPQTSAQTPLLNRMVLCKSQKLYFRTSLGLFPISSIDYTTKLLTISHNSCSSSSSNFISPSHLSAGFPSPPQPNSLYLFNCSNYRQNSMPFLRNCTRLHGCKASFLDEQENGGTSSSYSSCLVVDDIGKVDMGFHPRDLNCSRYSRVYRGGAGATLVDEEMENFKLGTRVSFDIPDHVPNPCDECEKAHGNCGVGLKCMCHPKECKDKVISMGVKMKPMGNILFSLVSFIVVRDIFKGS